MDDFELAQRNFLEHPGPEHYPALREAYEKRYGGNALAELVGFLEEHVAEIPTPWRHLALARLYDLSHRLAEAEYELERALELPEGKAWEVYELYIQILLKRKRWKAALDAAICCEETLKVELRDSQRATLYYYRACAAALAGDVEGGWGNLEAAEAYGFEKVRLRLLRLELLAGGHEKLAVQLQTLEELHNSQLSSVYSRRLQELEKRIRRVLLEALITQLSQLAEVYRAKQGITSSR